MIYPAPKISSGKAAFGGISSLSGDCAAAAAGMLGAAGVELCEGGAALVLIKDTSERLTYIAETGRLTDEKFIIESADGQITVRFSSERSLFYALLALGEGGHDCARAEDYPLFSTRGFIEGFYGSPWSFEERERTIALMGKKRMNTYYYAPKDDPLHRDRWRELYGGAELERLSAIIELCKKYYIDFNYCIAPGLSMRYSSPEDYRALMKKLTSLYDIGVRRFGLLLDDIPETLYYDEDKELFGSETVNAHIYLANKVYADLKALDQSCTLTVCPMQYHGKGNEYFISKFGSSINAGIKIFWTGYNICSQELTAAEAMRFAAATNHQPLYWDNFPVNDAEMVNEMHLGCLEGREPELCRHCEGLISNCMEYAECSLIPLMTAADFLWSPYDYDSRASWLNAVKEIAGGDWQALELFGDNLFFSCLKSENSSIFNRAAASAEQELFAGSSEKAFNILDEYCSRLEKCCAVITGSEKKIFRELDMWAQKQCAACGLLRAALNSAMTGDPSLREAGIKLLKEYKRIPEVLYDFSFIMTVERLLQL